MAKIMSLMYREWILMRKRLLLGLIIAAGLLMMNLFIGFNFQNGAYNGNEKLHDLLVTRGGYLEAYLVMFLLVPVSESCADAYESDLKVNWAHYSMTLPAESKARATAHILFLLIRTLAAFLISVIAGAVIPKAYGKPFSAGMIADIGLYCCISLVFICIFEFFQGRAKDVLSYKKQSSRMACSFGVLGAVVGLVFARSIMKTVDAAAEPLTTINPLLEKYTAFRNAAGLFIIPVFIGMMILNYVIVKRNLDSLNHS